MHKRKRSEIKLDISWLNSLLVVFCDKQVLHHLCCLNMDLRKIFLPSFARILQVRLERLHICTLLCEKQDKLLQQFFSPVRNEIPYPLSIDLRVRLSHLSVEIKTWLCVDQEQLCQYMPNLRSLVLIGSELWTPCSFLTFPDYLTSLRFLDSDWYPPPTIKFPLHLQHLDLGRYQPALPNTPFPITLKTLNLPFMFEGPERDLRTLTHLSSLEIKRVFGKKTLTLPSNLLCLKTRNIQDSPCLPTQLQELTLLLKQDSDWDVLPSSLRKLNIATTRAEGLWLPFDLTNKVPHLETLVLDGMFMSDLTKYRLPPSLKEIYINLYPRSFLPCTLPCVVNIRYLI